MDRGRYDLRVEDLVFDERGLIPAVVQQHDTLEVLMLAWMDAEALERTIDSGRAWYWSRSRQAYWMKGETSGHVQEVVEIRYDCDADTLLVLVDQAGPACHTGERTCFFRTLRPGAVSAAACEAEGNDVPLS